MLEEALEHLVRGIVDHPDDVRVLNRMLRRGNVLEVRVHPDDLGKVIGRGGRTARALRTVVGSLAGNRHVRIDLLETGEVRLSRPMAKTAIVSGAITAYLPGGRPPVPPSRAPDGKNRHRAHGRGGDSRKGDDLQVTVGRIGRPHGIRGDVVVGVRTDEPELRFAKGSRLDTDPVGVGPLTVAVSRWHSSELLIRFEGYGDRDAAAELRGTWLLVDSAVIEPSDDPDEFHDAELTGLSVRTVDGTPVGTVDDVLHSGQDVLLVKAADGREILIPFVKPFVPEVDVKAGFLVIAPPDGLLDP